VGKPAARIGDMHTCPMVDPGPKPHVGGPITGPGVPTVFIGGQPAAVVGDMATCAGPPDSIAMGSTGVFIGGKPAARMGDNTCHGGIITAGCPTVFIGEIAGGAGAGVGGGGSGVATAAGQSAGATSAVAAARHSAALAGTGEGEKKETETHWLDVKFVDKAGYPIAGVGYELTGTDGKKSTGRLGGDGKIRKDGIDPGNATVQLFSVHNARWSTDKARVGDKVKLTADAVGYPAGTKAIFEIWERDINSPDDLIADIKTTVQGNKVEGDWKFEYTKDEDDPILGREGSRKCSFPEFYFTVKIKGNQARSSLLQISDDLEITLKDEDGDPIPDEEYIVFLSSGEMRKGKLDGNGKATEREVPPEKNRVVFPNVLKAKKLPK
jgi:uncharacterized Zn-binding protein involved in type VI secretion